MTSYPPSTAISTSPSYIQSVFNSALDIYKEQTGHDLVLNPLLHHLQSCHSINDILSVLREQIPISSPSQSRDERFSNWLIPIVNVLFAFSASLGEGISLVFPPSKVIFAGICVLFLAVKDARASRDNLVNLFDRIGYFFHRLEIYTGVPPTPSMTDLIVEIMLEVLTILAIATKETKRGRFGRYLKNLMGNTDIVDALQKLDRLTQEEAHMASVELLKATHVIKLKVSEADEKVKGVDERVQKISAGLEDISNKVQATDDRVKDVGRNVEDMTNEMRCINDTIQGVDDTLDKVNRSSSFFNTLLSTRKAQTSS
ncbi:hypothetical protein F5148DRAFT_316022 [Russula earlei]|uniref:Uncharacterized protein n=1 Tax=Russula earlei TaxID=71964 RepID=A0ACC0U2Y4_9AGAM|nr:hypothetical protein F5148DRAFT_316022 [Russula earlei]